MAAIGLPIFIFILIIGLGVTLVTVPFFPAAYSSLLPQLSKDGKDPKSDINNLTDYGKNMVYAGIAMIIIPLFIIIMSVIAFRKKMGI